MKINDIVNEGTIAEVLDTPATNVTWDTFDPDLIKGNFTASNGVPYTLYITAPYMGPDEMDPYEFFPGLDDDAVWDRARFIEFEITPKKQYGKGKQGVEGTGAAAEVFGIVANALLEYIKKYKPSMLYFQAAEANRARLYAALAKRMLKSMPAWGLKVSNDGHHIALFNKRLLKKAGVAEDWKDKAICKARRRWNC